MKLVTLKKGSKICSNPECNAIIREGDKGWKVIIPRRHSRNLTKWYCKKCGDGMQI